MIKLLLIIAGCLLGLLLLGVLVAGIIVILNGGKNGIVSTARQGWINRCSDKDEEAGSA